MKNLIVEPYIFAKKDQLEKAREAGHLVACFGKPEYGDMIALYSQSSIDALCEKINAFPQWQLIETAPKTLKVILVYCADRQNIYTAYYRGKFVQTPGWRHFGGNIAPQMMAEEPTHWMPLPAGPK